MIETEQIRAIKIHIQNEDVECFISLLEKLLIASKQSGFKKPFNEDERDLIKRIADSLGLDDTEECKIVVEKEQTITKNIE